MGTQSIPRQEWNAFFDNFSKDHLEQTASLQIFGQAIGDQLVAEEQLFRGISADLKDGENRIAIQLGASINDGTTHSISAPVTVSVTEGDHEFETSLEILAEDGTSVLLRMVQPTLPTLRDSTRMA